MFGMIKKMFIGLLIGLFNASTHAKCVSLSNQKSEIQFTLITLHPNENNQELHCYPFELEVVIPLLNYLREYVLQIKQTI